MRLENNFIIRKLLKIHSLFLLFKNLVYLMIFIEKKIISLPILIKVGIVFAYLTGCLLRNDVKKKYKFDNYKWYV